jgi:hypothetical protein
MNKSQVHPFVSATSFITRVLNWAIIGLLGAYILIESFDFISNSPGSWQSYTILIGLLVGGFIGKWQLVPHFDRISGLLTIYAVANSWLADQTSLPIPALVFGLFWIGLQFRTQFIRNYHQPQLITNPIAWLLLANLYIGLTWVPPVMSYALILAGIFGPLAGLLVAQLIKLYPSSKFALWNEWLLTSIWAIAMIIATFYVGTVHAVQLSVAFGIGIAFIATFIRLSIQNDTLDICGISFTPVKTFASWIMTLVNYSHIVLIWIGALFAFFRFLYEVNSLYMIPVPMFLFIVGYVTINKWDRNKYDFIVGLITVVSMEVAILYWDNLLAWGLAGSFGVMWLGIKLGIPKNSGYKHPNILMDPIAFIALGSVYLFISKGLSGFDLAKSNFGSFPWAVVALVAAPLLGVFVRRHPRRQKIIEQFMIVAMCSFVLVVLRFDMTHYWELVSQTGLGIVANLSFMRVLSQSEY